jgi:hypothetical protein
LHVYRSWELYEYEWERRRGKMPRVDVFEIMILRCLEGKRGLQSHELQECVESRVGIGLKGNKTYYKALRKLCRDNEIARVPEDYNDKKRPVFYSMPQYKLDCIGKRQKILGETEIEKIHQNP